MAIADICVKHLLYKRSLHSDTLERSTVRTVRTSPRTIDMGMIRSALVTGMSSSNYRHQIDSGEDYENTLSFKNPDGEPEDLTGSTFTSDICNFLDTVVTAFTCTLSATPGDLVVSLPKAESIRLIPTVRYTHKLKRVYPDGKVQFPIYGDIVVR